MLLITAVGVAYDTDKILWATLSRCYPLASGLTLLIGRLGEKLATTVGLLGESLAPTRTQGLTPGWNLHHMLHLVLVARLARLVLTGVVSDWFLFALFALSNGMPSTVLGLSPGFVSHYLSLVSTCCCAVCFHIVLLNSVCVFCCIVVAFAWPVVSLSPLGS